MDIEKYLPFFIFLLIVMLRLFKGKKKEEKKISPLPSKTMPSHPKAIQSFRMPLKAPKAPLQTKALKEEKERYQFLQVKKDSHYHKKKTEKRIGRLISSLESKKKLILISEILKKPKGF